MDQSDYELLNEVTTLWGTVQRENFLDRELVTEEEWRQWRKFDDSVTNRLNSIIDNLSGNLSIEDTAYLETIKLQVASAKRLKTDELLRRKATTSEIAEQLRGNLFKTETLDGA